MTEPQQQQPISPIRSALVAAASEAPAKPDLAAQVYQSLDIDAPGAFIRGDQVSVSKLQPGDLVGWHGGNRQGQYQGALAVYAGDGEIIESVSGIKRRRKLRANENVFGMPVNLPEEMAQEL